MAIMLTFDHLKTISGGVSSEMVLKWSTRCQPFQALETVVCPKKCLGTRERPLLHTDPQTISDHFRTVSNGFLTKPFTVSHTLSVKR
jgi:hypothetical protein